MKSIILVSLLVVAGCITGPAFANVNGTGPHKTTVACDSELVPSGKGGDYFPWSLATNFPWDEIKGSWKAHGNGNINFKFAVIRTTPEVKQLAVEMINTRKKAGEQKIRGIGLVTSSNPNVIKMISGTQMIKIAMFNSTDIKAYPESCGEQVLAVSSYQLNCDMTGCADSSAEDLQQGSKSNMLLKKVSNYVRFRLK